MWGIRHFKLYLAGKRFTLQTDHKPLEYLKDAAYQNDRVFRWAMVVQEYSCRVEDIPERRTLRQIFGAKLDILVNGKTFIRKYIFLFLWFNALKSPFNVCKIIIIVIIMFRIGVMSLGKAKLVLVYFCKSISTVQ